MHAGLLLAACLSAKAGDFAGVVTHVTDGDTLWVRPASGGAPRQVRIEGIDAPEICQAFGAQARQALAARVLRRPVVVRSQASDNYQRMLGHISSQGEVDVGAWMVSSGHAWSYRFRGDPGRYAAEQAGARTSRLGLWHADTPVSPQEFRKRHGSCVTGPERRPERDSQPDG